MALREGEVAISSGAMQERAMFGLCGAGQRHRAKDPEQDERPVPKAAYAARSRA